MTRYMQMVCNGETRCSVTHHVPTFLKFMPRVHCASSNYSGPSFFANELLELFTARVDNRKHMWLTFANYEWLSLLLRNAVRSCILLQATQVNDLNHTIT